MLRQLSDIIDLRHESVEGLLRALLIVCHVLLKLWEGSHAIIVGFRRWEGLIELTLGEEIEEVEQFKVGEVQVCDVFTGDVWITSLDFN